MPNLHRIATAALLVAALSASDAAADDSTSDDSPWGVEAGTWEAGLYWGFLVADEQHELFEGSTATFQELERVTPALGLRGGYFPLRVLGLEVEAGLMPSQTRMSGDGVNLFALRGHAVLLAPTRAIVPFLVVGGGLLGISSEDAVLGSETDASFHVGLGVRAFVTRDLAVRVDVRDNLTSGLGQEEMAQHWEALLGISVVAGRPEPPPAPPSDRDGDGIVDGSDACPTAPGPAPQGCPPPPDADADGIADALDRCPSEAGVESADPERRGCPPPPPDGDGDGVADASDRCPTEAGDGPDGCPADGDGDGIVNRDDKCAAEPETKNGYEDQDGCPDELPQAVQAFTGAIEGIAFDANQATIRASSFAKLDEAAKVLTEYATLRVEIAGHTDASGKPERNLELSTQRAEAVKTYLVGKGVTADRITTRGAGPNEPVADNETREGRAKNRRIEFKLLQ